jgi:alpha-tubulin suppressor-like RCC1 family protein
MKRLAIIVAVVLFLGSPILDLSMTTASAGATERVRVDGGGNQGNSGSSHAALGTKSRYVGAPSQSDARSRSDDPTLLSHTISAGWQHTCGVRTDGTMVCWGNNNFGQLASPAGTFTQVSAGEMHTCGVRTDGTLACWGWNGDGQATPPAGTFTQVSAGEMHTCGVKTDGTLACWGNNSFGQATPPAGTFTQVEAGRHHTCGAKTDGTLACWGSNSFGQATPPTGTFTQVSAGYDHTCGVRTDGTLACWGANNNGQAMPPASTFTAISAGEDRTCAVKTGGTLACWGYNPYAPPAGTFTQVNAGYQHTCGVETDGTLACWGQNAFGDATPPADTFGPRQVSAGDYHTCAVRTDGHLACWGANYYGQATPPAGTFTSVSAGGAHTCGVKVDGTPACWGNNYYGQATPPAGTFTQVSAGENHTCLVRTDGTLVCSGDNSYEQATPPAGTFTQVSAGGFHTCGLEADGTLACWGDNYYGQATPPAGTFTQVSAGYWHACGVKTDGTLACWGHNSYGEATPPAGTFTSVSAGGLHTCGVSTAGTLACWGLSDAGQATPPAGTFTQLGAGGFHTCGVKVDGTLVCWGDNSEGQATPPTGTIAIVKATVPTGGSGFAFTDNMATPNNFSLDDGGTETFSNVFTDTYTVIEDDPEVTPGGFTLAALTCTDPDGGSSADVGARKATIDLDAGETVACTFTNSAPTPTPTATPSPSATATPSPTPTPTSTSMPSTPTLEDNFDDGVIDTSKWSVEVARPGYGIWKLPELGPPFIQATEGSGELRLAGNGHDYYDYGRLLISKNTFSGSFTLEVELTSLSGSGTQWGANVAIVKDDFTAIQLLQGVHRWYEWPTDYHYFGWQARESCIDGTPGCPTSPGGSGTGGYSDGEARAPGLISLPIKLTIVYDGQTQFNLYWEMGGQVYEATHNSPEVYDHYRIAIGAAARLGGDYVDARFDNFRLLAGQPAAVGGIAELPALAGASPQETNSPNVGSGWSGVACAALVVGVTTVGLSLGTGAWYARRKWLRRRG